MTIPKVTGNNIIPSGGLKNGLSPFASPQLCPPPPNPKTQITSPVTLVIDQSLSVYHLTRRF